MKYHVSHSDDQGTASDGSSTRCNVICSSPELLQPLCRRGIELSFLQFDCQGQYRLVNVRSQWLRIRAIDFFSGHIGGCLGFLVNVDSTQSRLLAQELQLRGIVSEGQRDRAGKWQWFRAKLQTAFAVQWGSLVCKAGTGYLEVLDSSSKRSAGRRRCDIMLQASTNMCPSLGHGIAPVESLLLPHVRTQSVTLPLSLVILHRTEESKVLLCHLSIECRTCPPTASTLTAPPLSIRVGCPH